MSKKLASISALFALSSLACVQCVGNAATAQVKPASSGQPSFYEPEMRNFGAGVYHPNAERPVPPAPRPADINRSALPTGPSDGVDGSVD